MSNEQRLPHFEAQLREIYKKISYILVVRTGTVVVDEDDTQSGLFIWSADDEYGSLIFSNIASQDMETAFDMMDATFTEGILIGIRESLRLAKEHLDIRRKEPGSYGRLSALDTFCESLEYLLNEVKWIDDLDADIIEPVTFFHSNPQCNPDIPETYKNMICWHLDTSRLGNKKTLDYSPEKIFETLDEFWRSLQDAKEKSTLEAE